MLPSPAQDAGPRRLAKPSSYGAFIHTSQPVLTGAFVAVGTAGYPAAPRTDPYVGNYHALMRDGGPRVGTHPGSEVEVLVIAVLGPVE